MRSNPLNRVRYTLYAPFYDLLVRSMARHRRRALRLLAPQPGERVLLVGAGTGLDLEHLPGELEVTATDLVPAMVRRLRRRAARLGREVEARVMDARRLAFTSGAFDCVVLHLILAVVPQPRRVIREAERVLKPGGRAVIWDKFLPDGARPSLRRRALNLPARLLATDINRRLGDILAGTALVPVHEEPAGFGGMFKIVVVEKPLPS